MTDSTKIPTHFLVPRTDYHKPTEQCKTCGGACCMQYSGITHPSDFGEEPAEIRKNIAEALRSKFFVIDWWEGTVVDRVDTNSINFVRPAHKDSFGLIKDGSYGGVCVFLDEKAHKCMLSINRRPKQCRHLKPEKDGCTCDYDKRDAAFAWLLYHEYLEYVAAQIQRDK